MPKQPSKSALIHLLMALMPYSRDNLKLAFAPRKFFYDLSKTSNINERTLRVAFSRAKSRGLIIQNDATQQVELSEAAKFKVQPFIAKKLNRNGHLLIIFDIPENQAAKRRQLRALLKTWEFKQIQKSVWATSYDYVEYLSKAIEEWGLKEYVELYEGARI